MEDKDNEIFERRKEEPFYRGVYQFDDAFRSPRHFMTTRNDKGYESKFLLSRYAAM